MLLGALLTASLDPAGKCPVPLASGCHPVPPEGGGKKQMEAGYKIGQIAARLRGMGNFPAQPHRGSGVGSWVELGALRERELS